MWTGRISSRRWLHRKSAEAKLHQFMRQGTVGDPAQAQLGTRTDELR